MNEYEKALLVGGPLDGREVSTYPGQGSVSSTKDGFLAERYKLHRVHDSRGFHRLIGLLENDARGPMQALYEGYGKAGAR